MVPQDIGKLSFPVGIVKPVAAIRPVTLHDSSLPSSPVTEGHNPVNFSQIWNEAMEEGGNNRASMDLLLADMVNVPDPPVDPSDFERVEFDVGPGYANGADPHAGECPRWQWRKYGTKLCRKRMIYRSYYRCMGPGCLAKKSLLHEEKKMSRYTAIKAVGFVGCHCHNPPVSIPKRGRKKKVLATVEESSRAIVKVESKENETTEPLASSTLSIEVKASDTSIDAAAVRYSNSVGPPVAERVNFPDVSSSPAAFDTPDELPMHLQRYWVKTQDPVEALVRLQEENRRLLSLVTSLSQGRDISFLNRFFASRLGGKNAPPDLSIQQGSGLTLRSSAFVPWTPQRVSSPNISSDD